MAPASAPATSTLKARLLEFAKTDLVRGSGAELSIFRRPQYIWRMGRAVWLSSGFVFPAAIGVAWLAYPALTKEFKEEMHIP